MVCETLSTPKHASFSMNKKIFGFLSVILLMFGFSVLASAQKKSGSDYKIATAGVGFDGIRIGISTRADVIRKYGRNFNTKTHGRYSAQMVYPGGISFYYCQRDRQQEIFDIELRSPARVKTAKGIVLNRSRVSELRKKYGEPREGLRFQGIEFYYIRTRGKRVITVIDIVEKNGMRECE